MDKNNLQWLEKTKKEAAKYPEAFQYLLDRLYYAEQKNEKLGQLLDNYKSENKKIPVILEQETAEKFLNLLGELINERNEDKLFDKIIKGLRSVFGYDRAGLMLYDDQTEKIECVRSLGLPVSYTESLHIHPSETEGEKMRNHVARCFSERKSFFITDRFKEKKFNVRMKDEQRVYSTQYAVAPVYGKTKTYGVITVAVQPHNKYFMTENEIVILEFVSHQIGSIIENSTLNAKIETFYKDLIVTFSNLIEDRDKCTAGHCGRLVLYSQVIGEKLKLNNAELREIELAAALHDIGKISISDELLNKPGKLTNEEYEEVKVHAAKGAEIMKPFSDYKNVISAIKYHHERWDGAGYPEGLKGEEIPYYARILAVIDAFDVMINFRTYKEPKSIADAKKELKKYAGTQFDSELCRFMTDLSDEEIEQIQKS